MPALGRLDRATLHERVYAEIRSALMQGRFAPGETVTIRAFAEALGTSAMPVREALRRLIAERALEARPNRSIAVPTVTRERFIELRDVRTLLEGLAAEHAAGRLGLRQGARLAQLCERMAVAVERRDVRAYLAQNEEFHLTIYRAAGSELLLGLIETLWLQVGPLFNYLFGDLGVALRGVGHHEEALEAIRAGEGGRAREAIVADISDAADLLVNYLPPAAAQGRA